MGIRHKTLYIIRHGETSSNVEKRFQGSEEELTKRGREQARALATRLSANVERFPIEVILTSSDKRACETATIIRSAFQNPPRLTMSALFVERRHPSRIWGKPTSDEEAVAIHQEGRLRFHDRYFRYEDGETFSKLRVRANSAMEMILGMPEKNIALVTHGVFGTMLTAVSQAGKRLTSHELNAYQFRLDNTGLSILGFETRANFSETSDGWVIHKWNDTAHLE